MDSPITNKRLRKRTWLAPRVCEGFKLFKESKTFWRICFGLLTFYCDLLSFPCPNWPFHPPIRWTIRISFRHALEPSWERAEHKVNCLRCSSQLLSSLGLVADLAKTVANRWSVAGRSINNKIIGKHFPILGSSNCSCCVECFVIYTLLTLYILFLGTFYGLFWLLFFFAETEAIREMLQLRPRISKCPSGESS